MRCHFIPSRMVVIKETENNNFLVILPTITIVGKDVEELKLSYNVGGAVKLFGCFGKQFGSTSKC